jgi:ankyrin repeat protein
MITWRQFNQSFTTREDRFGQTPLHDAAQYGYKDIAGLLIDYGTDVNVRDKFRWTPLHAAVAGGHKDMAELLIANGADVNAKRYHGSHSFTLGGSKEDTKKWSNC